MIAGLWRLLRPMFSHKPTIHAREIRPIDVEKEYRTVPGRLARIRREHPDLFAEIEMTRIDREERNRES